MPMKMSSCGSSNCSVQWGTMCCGHLMTGGRIGDPLVFSRAVSLGRVILTNNRRDYHKLHRIDPLHAGIITYTDDPDRAALAARIDTAIASRPVLDGLLVKVIRPNNPLANRKPRIIPGSTSP